MDSFIRSQFPVSCQLNMIRIIIICDEDHRGLMQQITFGHNIKPQMATKPFLYFFVYYKLQNPSSRNQKKMSLKDKFHKDDNEFLFLKPPLPSCLPKITKERKGKINKDSKCNRLTY